MIEYKKSFNNTFYKKSGNDFWEIKLYGHSSIGRAYPVVYYNSINEPATKQEWDEAKKNMIELLKTI